MLLICVKFLFTEEIKVGKRKVGTSLSPVPSEIFVLPKRTVSQIAATRERFIFDGKVLNIYGTYESDKDWRYLITDLTDELGFEIVTVVAGSNYYNAILSKIIVGF